jgi:Tfp pilus assembly pilus retraction ATPase PilT
LRKISEIFPLPNLTDIHIVFPKGGGNIVMSRFRVAGAISGEEEIEIDVPEVLGLPDFFNVSDAPKEGRRRGVYINVGNKQYRLRLTLSESLGRALTFVRILPEHPLPIEAVSAEYFFKGVENRKLLGSGLFLVAGQTGSGKSTYIASVLQHIAAHFPIHIVSLEDPVEYIITPQKGYATQKEVYFDSPSFKTALRASMREDPDVLFIGEIRDLETTETALSAAESGHLVFGTIHAGSNAGIVDRLLGFFNSADSAFAAQRISQCLRMCLFIKRSGMLARYAYEEVGNSLRTIIRNRMLHQWLMYASPVTKEINWGNWENH